MAINTLAMATLFQAKCDQQITQVATTGWMEGNSGQVVYNGGSEVKIPTLTMDGLGDYVRNQGYKDGGVTLAYATYTMSQDRGRSFKLDPIDINEANFVPQASYVMSEFQRTKVIPEIDAYRYSKIASLAIAGNQSRDLAVTSANALNELLADIAAIRDKGVTDQLIISLSPLIIQLLSNDVRFSNLAESTILSQGNLTLNLQGINGNVLRPVSSDRLHTAYTFADGETAGQTAGGFTTATGSKKINWLISSADAPIALAKTDNIRIFDPNTYQGANSWAIDYRKFHDLWIPTNKLVKVFANTDPTAQA